MDYVTFLSMAGVNKKAVALTLLSHSKACHKRGKILQG